MVITISCFGAKNAVNWNDNKSRIRLPRGRVKSPQEASDRTTRLGLGTGLILASPGGKARTWAGDGNANYDKDLGSN